MSNLQTKPNKEGFYTCDWCNHKPYRRYGSYHTHATRCQKNFVAQRQTSERCNDLLETKSNDTSSSSRVKKKGRLTIKKSRELIAENKKLIESQKLQIDGLKLEMQLMRNDKSALQQEIKLLNAKFDTINSKNTLLLQMVENFAIEFLKTRQYEFCLSME